VSVEAKGLLLGGLMPALMFGLAGVLQKATLRAGAGMGPYLICVGAGVLIIGAALAITASGQTITLKAGFLAGTLGLVWGVATWLVALSLARYAVPLAKLVPLYNMNTLVVVVLALVVFAEWRDVAVVRLLLGAALVVLGGTLVARA
jgi:transporter family protein